MAHMVWQGVLHMGTLALKLPQLAATPSGTSCLLVAEAMERALKGLRPAIKYFIISSHKPLSKKSYGSTSQAFVRPEGKENWM